MAVTDRLIAMPEVVERAGISRGTIYTLMGQNRFPRPLHLSKRVTRWLASDIESWLQERIEERNREREATAVTS